MHELLPVVNEGTNETAICVSVPAEPLGRRLDRPVQQDGLLVIERVGQGHGRVNPLEAVGSEVEGPKEGGRYPQRVYGGTDIVAKTGKGELFGASPASDRLAPFEEKNGTPPQGEGCGGGKPVGAGAHNDRIVFLFRSGLPYWHDGVSLGR